MMSTFDLLFLSVALAMDCFTVSIVCGVIAGRPVWSFIWRLSFLFGLFQALMPLLGWLGTTHFAAYIQAYDHWIAFGLLGYLGVSMIRDSLRPEEKQTFNPFRWRKQIQLAVATSIDALAVGISFACTGFTDISSLVRPLVFIGTGSLVFGILGQGLGIRYGRVITRRLKPGMFGGIILLLIGLKVLVTHLSGQA